MSGAGNLGCRRILSTTDHFPKFDTNIISLSSSRLGKALTLKNQQCNGCSFNIKMNAFHVHFKYKMLF